MLVVERVVRPPYAYAACVCCRRVAYWFLSFRLTKPVSHPPSRGGVPPLCRWASLDCKQVCVYIYIYIYTHMHACVCVCVRVYK